MPNRQARASLSILLSTLLLANTLAISCKDGKDTNCLKCQSDKCTICKDSYPDPDGICQAPSTKIEGCHVYASPNTCMRCTEGYSLTDDSCKQNNDEECRQESPDGTCLVCDGFVTESDGTCGEYCEYGCKFCSGSSCKQCYEGLVPVKSWKYAFVKVYKECQEGNGLLAYCVSEDFKCTECIDETHLISKSGQPLECGYGPMGVGLLKGSWAVAAVFALWAGGNA